MIALIGLLVFCLLMIGVGVWLISTGIATGIATGIVIGALLILWFGGALLAWLFSWADPHIRR